MLYLFKRLVSVEYLEDIEGEISINSTVQNGLENTIEYCSEDIKEESPYDSFKENDSVPIDMKGKNNTYLYYNNQSSINLFYASVPIINEIVKLDIEALTVLDEYSAEYLDEVPEECVDDLNGDPLFIE